MSDVPELIPVRMINEFVYCPRLFYLEWVQGEWADNAHTEDGRFVHRRVDKKGGRIAEPEDEAPFSARSVSISAPILGVSAKIDLVEGEGGEVSPVEYKRGSPAPVPGGVWDPERVQVCAQALALRENGYSVSRGFVYFRTTREKIEVPIDQELVTRTLNAIWDARASALAGEIPPPLHGSPKCAGCSLNGICLPDEVRFLTAELDEVRLLQPARDDAVPVYLQTQGAKLGISNEVLCVRGTDGKKIQEIRLGEVSQVNIMGNVSVTTPAMRELATKKVPLSFFSFGGWFYGRLDGAHHKNVELRRAQYRSADMPGVCLALAKRFVTAKVANSRTLLRRNHPEAPRAVLEGMDELKQSAMEANDLAALLGLEGSAARLYFSAFGGMLKPSTPDDATDFEMNFDGRNRRPPLDPVNSLLSFTYALLTKDWTNTVGSVGFEPFLGFYHQPRYGRPSLALDLMEEFRPLIADSVVLTAINTGIVTATDFVRTQLGVSIKDPARKRVVQAYERRMDQLVTHPVFDYRISYRRVLEVQARLLGRFLLGEIPTYPSFTTR